METNQITIKLTQDQEVEKLPYFQAIVTHIEQLESTGILINLDGNCLAAADLLSGLLLQSGIENTIVECQATVQLRDENNQTRFTLIGHDNLSFQGQVDTHVVVVTKTPIPLLIDISILGYLPEDHPFIIEKVDNSDPSILGNYKFKNFSILYQIKRNLRLPGLHQKGILQRMNEENNVKTKIKSLSNFIYFILFITVVNLIFNFTLLLLKTSS